MCEAEFNKLDAAEQAKFVRLDQPTSYIDFGPTHQWTLPRHDMLELRAQVAQQAQLRHQQAQQAKQLRQQKAEERRALAMKRREEAQKRRQAIQAQRKEARVQFQQFLPVFVQDLTVDDDTVVQLGSTLDKQWMFRAGPAGLPAGTCVVEVGGQRRNNNNRPLLAAKQAYFVNHGHAVHPNTEFTVQVELKVAEHPRFANRKARSVWRFQDSCGRKFGPKFWAQVVVAAPTPTPISTQVKPDMTFVADVTVPDGSVVELMSQVRKTWHVRSERGWGLGNTLRCLDSDGPYAGLAEDVPSVPAGAEADLSISLTAPAQTDGVSAHRSYWGLVDAQGKRFGDQLWVDFVPRHSENFDLDALLEEACEPLKNGDADADDVGGGQKEEAEAKESESESEKKEEEEKAKAKADGVNKLNNILKAVQMFGLLQTDGEVVQQIVQRLVQTLDSQDFAKVLQDVSNGDYSGLMKLFFTAPKSEE